MKSFLKKASFAACSVLIAFSMTSCTGRGTNEKPEEETKPEQEQMPEEAPPATETTRQEYVPCPESMELVLKMGIGINLGNTMEACGDWIDKSGGISNFERAWGSPLVTQEMINGYAKAGFTCIRIPVAWSNLISTDGNYTINSELLNRVQQIVDWALDAGLYVVMNEHWDYGWFKDFPTKKDECMKRFLKIWAQVADRFKDYDNRLIFEAQNEEGGWDSIWNPWGGTPEQKKKSYDLLNEINQAYVDFIRTTGGNNDKRLLLIMGYNTGFDRTADPLFVMPYDEAGMLAVSVHYYSPATFAILSEDADWGKNRETWGTPKDLSELAATVKLMKNAFIDKGIPVIVGEYGCPTKNKEMESVRLYLQKVCQRCYLSNMCPILWDTPGGFYNRKTCKIDDETIKQNYADIVKEGR